MFPIIRTLLTTYRRNGTLWQFFGLSIVWAIVSIIATSISLNEGTKVMNDIRLTGIEIIGLISVVFFVATIRDKSRRDQTLQLLLTHYPHISRIYIAQIFANIGLIGLLYIIMSVIAIITMFIAGHPPIAWFGLAVWWSFIKMICLTTIAQFLGSLVSGYLASILSFALYIIGHSTGFVLYYLQRQWEWLLTRIGRILYYVLPNFQALDSHNVFSHTISSIDIVIGISIMVAYSIVITTIGITHVNHQEL